MNSPSNRRRGNASVRKAGNLPKRHNGPSQTGKAFPKTETAKTAKYQMHERDREQLHKVEAKYLKPTPQEVAVFKADIIIAGKHLTPSGLEEPGAFNAIRKAHQVYVDYIDESDTIIVSAESISQLKDAVKAVQWLIHDRRLSHDLPATSFIIQKPLEAHDQTPISVVLGRRPCSIGAQKSMPDSADMSRIANNLVEPLRRDIVTSAERLMGIGKQLRARINFGRVNIRQKKKGLGNELSHTSFADFMKACSIRGGAGLATRMPDVQLANAVIKSLSTSDQVCTDITSLCCLNIFVGGRELKADIVSLSGSKPQVSSDSISQLESWPRLNWTVVSPDRQFDWNLQIDCMETPHEVVRHLQSLLPKISLSANEASSNNFVKIPRINHVNLGPFHDQIERTRLDSSVTFPFRGTPYMIKVHVTHEWKGFEVSGEPEKTWGIQMFGIRWDEAVNTINPETLRKDWGDNLENVWPGAEQTLDKRLEDFLLCIQQVQAALDNVCLASGAE